jgi:hypothetical protein
LDLKKRVKVRCLIQEPLQELVGRDGTADQEDDSTPRKDGQSIKGKPYCEQYAVRFP